MDENNHLPYTSLHQLIDGTTLKPDEWEQLEVCAECLLRFAAVIRTDLAESLNNVA